jgi:hypothetical protein
MSQNINAIREIIEQTNAATQRRNLPRSLPPAGALATLLVVEGLLDIADAANAVRVSPQSLITEAEGWAAAMQMLGEQNGD